MIALATLFRDYDLTMAQTLARRAGVTLKPCAELMVRVTSKPARNASPP